MVRNTSQMNYCCDRRHTIGCIECSRVARLVPACSGELLPMPQQNRTRISLSTPIVRFALTAAFGFMIYGCSAQAPSPPPLPPVQPATAPQPVVTTAHEVGPTKVTTASFYAPELQGHATTSGENYNQHAMTAASRTLPIGAHAKVTNLKNGQAVVVRINDRGPFVKGRGIDLSHDAAKHIGLDDRGTAKVKVTRLEGSSGEAGDSSDGTGKAHDAPPAPPTGSASLANPPVTESSGIPKSVKPSSEVSSSLETVSPSE